MLRIEKMIKVIKDAVEENYESDHDSWLLNKQYTLISTELSQPVKYKIIFVYMHEKQVLMQE